jgi:hypothetical protein
MKQKTRQKRLTRQGSAKTSMNAMRPHDPSVS